MVKVLKVIEIDLYNKLMELFRRETREKDKVPRENSEPEPIITPVALTSPATPADYWRIYEEAVEKVRRRKPVKRKRVKHKRHNR